MNNFPFKHTNEDVPGDKTNNIAKPEVTHEEKDTARNDGAHGKRCDGGRQNHLGLVLAHMLQNLICNAMHKRNNLNLYNVSPCLSQAV